MGEPPPTITEPTRTPTDVRRAFGPEARGCDERPGKEEAIVVMEAFYQVSACF
jgi:hypothetical protein